MDITRNPTRTVRIGHVTIGGGTALYNGDLGNAPGDNFLGPALNLGVLYRLSPHFHLGSEFTYAKIGARDRLKVSLVGAAVPPRPDARYFRRRG